MQNVVGEGDFEHYQGVWRMQSLPNCNLAGGDHAARLSYAVEIKVRPIFLIIFLSLPLLILTHFLLPPLPPSP